MEPNSNKSYEQDLLEVERKLLMFKTMMQGIQVNIAELEKSNNLMFIIALTDIKNKVIPNNHHYSVINIEDNKTPEKNCNKETVKKEVSDNISKFNNKKEQSLKEEKEGNTKIIDNYKEKLFNYKEFKPTDNIKNTGGKVVPENKNILNKDNSSWLKKENVNTNTNTKIDEKKEVKNKNSENELIIKLSQDPKPSIFDELFDEDKPIRSKLSDEEEEINNENNSNIEEEDNFLKRKRVVKTKPKSIYNNFFKLRKVKIQPKSYLGKAVNTVYKKAFEENKEIIDLDINSNEEEPNNNDFYSIKGPSNTGFINSNKAKQKRKEFKGYQCTVCHQVKKS